MQHKQKARAKYFSYMKQKGVFPKRIEFLILLFSLFCLSTVITFKYALNFKKGEKMYFENMDDLIHKIKIEQTKEQDFLKSISNDILQGKDTSKILEKYDINKPLENSF